MSETAHALFYSAPGACEVRELALAPLAPGEVEVRTLFSALSRGTERLVFEGRVPASERTRMRAPFQEGEFSFPVKYGYAAVGRIEAGPEELLGRNVFCLHPHQTRFRVPAEAVLPLPEAVPPARAVLAANAETALNAIWDAELAPGDRVLVLGAGLLGCLIAAFLSRTHARLYLTDKLAERVAALADFRVSAVSAQTLADDFDVVFHTTGAPEGLQAALDALAFEGRVIELSWFGDRMVPLALGGAFHARRLTIRASQVGHVAPARRATISGRDRLAQALALLDDARLDRLITGEVRFVDLPREIGRLLAADAPGIATRVRYD